MIPPGDRRAVKRIRRLQREYNSLPDAQLRERAQALRGLPAARIRDRLFALAALAVRRALGLEPFDEQLFYDLLMEKCKTSRRKEEKDITISTEGSY